MKPACIAFALCVLASFGAVAQTDLPTIKVTAPPYSSQHGGYLISGNFKVDPRMPGVVFPAQALAKGDILNIVPMSLQDNEYLVLQECASADCREASVVRYWNASDLGSDTVRYNRVQITHGNKYFIWLKRFPVMSGQSCGQGWFMFDKTATQCGSRFTSFEQISPPLTLIPTGMLAAYHRSGIAQAAQAGPVHVANETHEGATFVVTYDSGSVVRIQRMHATHDDDLARR